MIHEIKIRRPDDFHVHLRDGSMRANIGEFTYQDFARALVMPNTQPPVLTGEDALHYRERIMSPTLWSYNFEPLMTIKITPDTTPEIISNAMICGVISGKLYPAGVTTNSDDGVVDIRPLYDVFSEMEKVGMVLCLHGESPGIFCLDAEMHFVEKSLIPIAKAFPNLAIVLEHVTDARSLDAVSSFENVAATVTVHHLFLTLHDIVGGSLNPHAFCKPIAKTPGDQAGLVRAVTQGTPRVFLGTDSAPHLRADKESDCGCAGVFSAPVAIPLLAQFFDEADALGRLEPFVSEMGAEFYGLDLNKGMLTLRKESWTVPDEIQGVVPFRAGQEITWKVIHD